MVVGTRPSAFQEHSMLQAEKGVDIPHDLPGQDPEGGSEVDFPLSPVDDPSSPVAADGLMMNNMVGSAASPNDQVKDVITPHCCREDRVLHAWNMVMCGFSRVL